MNDLDFGFDPQGGGFGGFSDPEMPADYPMVPAIRDCLSCGICVGVCPSYRVTSQANYAPRGRIRLLDRLINQGEALDAEELSALDACTLCLACEEICPSKMAYGKLYAQAQDKVRLAPKDSWLGHVLLYRLAIDKRSLDIAGRLLRFYQVSGLEALVRWLPDFVFPGKVKRLHHLLPENVELAKIPESSSTESTPSRGRLALFHGCLATLFDNQIHLQSIELLNTLGYDVSVPADQTCCGAMHAHHGDRQQARALAQQNQAAFVETKADSVIFNRSGCGAFLHGYGELLEHNDQQPPDYTDILEFLDAAEWPTHIRFTPLPLKVAVHEACSQRNQLKNQQDELRYAPGRGYPAKGQADRGRAPDSAVGKTAGRALIACVARSRPRSLSENSDRSEGEPGRARFFARLRRIVGSI